MEECTAEQMVPDTTKTPSSNYSGFNSIRSKVVDGKSYSEDTVLAFPSETKKFRVSCQQLIQLS
jgi:hypothetical protein